MTAIGKSIALPHVRNPIVLHVTRPIVTLCFLETPVDFGALDGKPVHTLFSLICPTVPSHLKMLSRLSYALSDPGFEGVVMRQGPIDEVLREESRVDTDLSARAVGAGKASEPRRRQAPGDVMSESLVLAGIVIAAASGLPGLFLSRHSMSGQWLTTLLAVLGAALGLAGVGSFWATGVGHPVASPWSIPGAEFRVAIDGLSAVFLVPIFLISLLGNIYGLGY